MFNRDEAVHQYKKLHEEFILSGDPEARLENRDEFKGAKWKKLMELSHELRKECIHDWKINHGIDVLIRVGILEQASKICDNCGANEGLHSWP